HTEYGFLFVSLSHSPTLPLSLYPSDRQVTCDPPGEAALWVKHTEFGCTTHPTGVVSSSRGSHRSAPVVAATWLILPVTYARSEERRVGKECRSRWSPYY